MSFTPYDIPPQENKGKWFRSHLLGREIELGELYSLGSNDLDLLMAETAEIRSDLDFKEKNIGKCDGSAPMCYPKNEYMVGSSDVKLGEIGGLPFYMNDDQYEKWKHTDLTIDAVKGIGGMFSLDNGTGKRFLTKSEICLVVDNDPKKN